MLISKRYSTRAASWWKKELVKSTDKRSPRERCDKTSSVVSGGSIGERARISPSSTEGIIMRVIKNISTRSIKHSTAFSYRHEGSPQQ